MATDVAEPIGEVLTGEGLGVLAGRLGQKVSCMNKTNGN